MFQPNYVPKRTFRENPTTKPLLKKRHHKKNSEWKWFQCIGCMFLSSLMISVLCLALVLWKEVNDLNDTVHAITDMEIIQDNANDTNGTEQQEGGIISLQNNKETNKMEKRSRKNSPKLSKTVAALGGKKYAHINLGKVKGTDGIYYTGLVHIHYSKPVMGPTSSANCWDLNAEGYRWKTTRDYYINTYNTRNLPSEWVTSVFYQTAENWNNVLSNFTIFGNPMVVDPIDMVTYTEQSNGVNEFFFGYIDIDSVIALTISWGIFDAPIEQRAIVECDIIFNDRDFSFGDGDERRDVMDLANIAAHEFGHCTGLSDLYTSRCSDDTMYGYSSRGETKKRQITNGAKTGLKVNYGELSAESIPPDLSENISTINEKNLFLIACALICQLKWR